MSDRELDLVRTPDGTFEPEPFERIFTGMSWLERIAIGGMVAGMLTTILPSLAAPLWS